MMWISNKMSLDWKPWKEGERKENEGKNPVLHVTLLDTLWKSSLLSTFGMLLCSIVYFCVGFFSLKEIKMMGKLACHIKLHHMFFYWQGKKKKKKYYAEFQENNYWGNVCSNQLRSCPWKIAAMPVQGNTLCILAGFKSGLEFLLHAVCWWPAEPDCLHRWSLPAAHNDFQVLTLEIFSQNLKCV